MKKNWWKALTIIILLFVVYAGFLMEVPRKPILNESIRNLYFHVPMWFGMIILASVSVFHSIRYLSTFDQENDIKSAKYINVTILFGILGLLTGMLWANYTWGKPWSNDIKQNLSAIALLIYGAQVVLRNSLADEQQRAKISAVYNIFSYPLLIALLFIIPRLTDQSLHPGSGGNPAFNTYELAANMRIVFYPAVIGWILLGVWIATLLIRFEKVKHKFYDN